MSTEKPAWQTAAEYAAAAEPTPTTPERWTVYAFRHVADRMGDGRRVPRYELVRVAATYPTETDAQAERDLLARSEFLDSFVCLPDRGDTYGFDTDD